MLEPLDAQPAARLPMAKPPAANPESLRKHLRVMLAISSSPSSHLTVSSSNTIPWKERQVT